jgi:hypothetical protein
MANVILSVSEQETEQYDLYLKPMLDDPAIQSLPFDFLVGAFKNRELYFNTQVDKIASLKTTCGWTFDGTSAFVKKTLEPVEIQASVEQCYTPLMRGQKHDDPRIVDIANRYGKTPAQIILRWAVQQGISTIPKSENPARIKENFDIFNFELSDDDLHILNNLNEHFRIVDNPIDML